MKRKTKADPRPSWEEYFLRIANDVSRRSNCSRRQVGAVIVKDNHILSTGYNGTPSRTKNCFDGGCPRCSGSAKSGTSLDECLCVHAEQNAICQAARYGLPVDGATIYITLSPCLTCAKQIINAGIKEVVYAGSYTSGLETVGKMFKSAGVKIRQYGFSMDYDAMTEDAMFLLQAYAKENPATLSDDAKRLRRELISIAKTCRMDNEKREVRKI